MADLIDYKIGVAIDGEVDDRLYTREEIDEAIELVVNLAKEHPDARITIEVVRVEA